MVVAGGRRSSSEFAGGRRISPEFVGVGGGDVAGWRGRSPEVVDEVVGGEGRRRWWSRSPEVVKEVAGVVEEVV